MTDKEFQEKKAALAQEFEEKYKLLTPLEACSIADKQCESQKREQELYWAELVSYTTLYLSILISQLASQGKYCFQCEAEKPSVGVSHFPLPMLSSDGIRKYWFDQISKELASNYELMEAMYDWLKNNKYDCSFTATKIFISWKCKDDGDK